MSQRRPTKPCATKGCSDEGALRHLQPQGPIDVCISCFVALHAREELEGERGRPLTHEEVETELAPRVQELLDRPVPMWAVVGLRP